MDPDIQTSLWKSSWLQSWQHYFHFWKEWWKEFDVFAICWYELDTGLRCNSSQGTFIVIMKCLKFWGDSQWVAVHMQTSTIALRSGRKRGAQVCELSGLWSGYTFLSCVCVCACVSIKNRNLSFSWLQYATENWTWCIYLEHERDLNLFSITHVQYGFQCDYSVMQAKSAGSSRCSFHDKSANTHTHAHINIYTMPVTFTHFLIW